MAKFKGNIWTKARGSIGSITFSEARDRKGKVQTARDRVTPLNPQTTNQTNARNNLTDSVFIVRGIQSQVGLAPFDRGISKLPGYQGLMSTYQKSKTANSSNITFDSVPPDWFTDAPHHVSISSIVNNNDGTYDISFSIDNGGLPPGLGLLIGACTRRIPIGSLETYRFQKYFTTTDGATSIEIDLGGFPTEDSGCFVFLYVFDQGLFTTRVSNITWGLQS